RARPRHRELIQVAHAVRPPEHALDGGAVQPDRVLRLAGGAGSLNQLHTGSARTDEEDPTMIMDSFGCYVVETIHDHGITGGEAGGDEEEAGLGGVGDADF